MRKLGLVIFLLSFGFFFTLLFTGSFQLSDQALNGAIRTVYGDNLDDSQKENLQKQLNKINYLKSTDVYKSEQTNVIHNQFKFVSIVENMANQANKLVVADNGVTKSEVSTLVYNSTIDGKVSFTQESIDKTFDVSTELGAFKHKKVTGSFKWMFGKKFKTIEKFQDKLTSKLEKIDASIIRSKGFDESKTKGLKYSVTKNATIGYIANNKWLLFFLTFMLSCIGGLMYILPEAKTYLGIKNDGIYHNKATNVGWIGILAGTFLISFYIALYWFPQYITSWIVLVDPLKQFFIGDIHAQASQWFLYGFLYCLAMIVMGIRMIVKYRHNKYQIVRTCSVIFFQVAFAFLIPEILARLNQPAFDFKNMWPLDYDFFYDWNIKNHLKAGSLGLFMFVWGILLFVVGVPVFVYFFGKRWYCSWVCGCGGLAETLGDPYRQLSDKSVKAWKIERYLIHGVLVFAVIMTAATLYSYLGKTYFDIKGASKILGVKTADIQSVYGFMIGSVFSGVVGTGFYPLMGNRTWCRFGCPLAAYLGIVQRFKSKFRITTNGGQCISCGNCSTYCEMGIDVRSYAQKGQNIVRSSCVGCGVCSAVCPRGVLKLENGPTEKRIDDNPIILGNDGMLKINDQAS